MDRPSLFSPPLDDNSMGGTCGRGLFHDKPIGLMDLGIVNSLSLVISRNSSVIENDVQPMNT